MTCRVLLRLCAAWLLFGLPVRGDVIVVVPPDGTPVKVPTPLSNGPVLVFTGTWAMLPATPQGSQRILRQVYATGHEVVRGRKEWLSIDKSGTASVKLQTVPEAAGESFTAWIACDVEEMERGTSSGTLYRNARIELTVVADLRKHLGDVILAPGDGVSVPLPPTIRVRRVSSVLEKVTAAEHEGSALVITAKEPGSTKVTLNDWIGDEVEERLSREVEVEVRERAPEHAITLRPAETPDGHLPRARQGPRRGAADRGRQGRARRALGRTGAGDAGPRRHLAPRQREGDGALDRGRDLPGRAAGSPVPGLGAPHAGRGRRRPRARGRARPGCAGAPVSGPAPLDAPVDPTGP